MVIKVKGGYLILDLGFLSPTYKIPLVEVKSWGFVAEENGATYFEFNYLESTQHVSITSSSPEAVKGHIEELTAILGKEPYIDISDERVLSAGALVAGVVTIEILAAVLLSAIGG